MTDRPALEIDVERFTSALAEALEPYIDELKDAYGFAPFDDAAWCALSRAKPQARYLAELAVRVAAQSAPRRFEPKEGKGRE